MDDERVCRVCRAGEESGPLYRPCRCKGSIEYCHEDCLKSWLSISRGHRCELCKHPFRWEKVYASQAPSRLPSLTILRHLLLGAFSAARLVLRFILVATVWIAILPYAILWAWRGFFHLGKSWGMAWTVIAREADWKKMTLVGFFGRNYNATAIAETAARRLASQAGTDIAASSSETLENRTIVTINRFVNGTLVSSSMRPKITSLEEVYRDFIGVWSNMSSNMTAAAKSTAQPGASLSRADAADQQLALLKGVARDLWKRHRDSFMTIANDCFTGQIIVCCVVVLFVAGFLLREWVVANQPQLQDAPAPAPPVQPALLLPAPAPAEQAAQAEDEELPPLEQLRRTLDFHEELSDDNEGAGSNKREEPPRDLPELDNVFSFVPPEPLQQSTNEQAGQSSSASRLPSSSGLGEDIPAIESEARQDAGPEQLSASARAFLERREQLQQSTLSVSAIGLLPAIETATDQDNQVEDPSASSEAASFTAIMGDEHNDSPGTVELPVFGPALRPEDFLDPPAIPARRGEDDDSDSSDDENDLPNPLRNRNRAVGGVNAADLAAIEAAEAEEELLIEADLQGIMEAIGLQGPIVALVQNAALMALLITSLLATIVWAPLMLGKTFVATNAPRAILLPINIVRYFTDPIADYSIGVATRARATFVRPKPPAVEPSATLVQRLTSITKAVSARLRKQPPVVEDLSYTQAFAAKARDYIRHYQYTAANKIQSARQISLARWQSMAIHDEDIDRILCIALGYTVVVVVAALWLRHTKNIQARNATRAAREALSQQIVLFKAASFFIIEIVLFPTMCGVLLNLATLPLLPGATIASRIAYHVHAPITSGFLTWLAGTNFMYLFAQAIGVIRKCLRKGVLWFIRDPTDPETNPLREILETPAFNQARKISRSLLVYGAIVLTCFGTFPWLTTLLNVGIFPLRWDMTRPISSVPVDLVLVLLVLPRTLGKFRIKRTLRKMLSQWCTITARQLRLSSFMLGVRRPEEEGTFINKTWKDWLLCKTRPSGQAAAVDMQKLSEGVHFRKDGAFARVVAADNVRIVPRAMFLRVKEDGSPLDDAGARVISDQLSKGPNDESKFTLVYIPPHFTSRICLFVYLLWFTGSAVIYSLLSAPLILGRIILDMFFVTPLHDTYSLLVGLHALLVLSKIYNLAVSRMSSVPATSPSINTSDQWQRVVIKSKTMLSHMLLYINAGLLLPFLLGAVFNLYVLAPFETGTGSRPNLSLSMSWCYGAILCQLAYSIAAIFPPNQLAPLIAPGITSAERNKRITIINLRLLSALLLPGLVALTYQQGTALLWRLRGQGSARYVVPRSYVYRAALFSVSCTSATVALAKPFRILASKWLAAVWEREYVIQKKLRNVDDPPVETETQEAPTRSS